MNRDRPECWHDYGGVKLMPMHFGGHALYVRKCETVVEWAGMITLPDSFKDHTNWVEVLASGPCVGTMCSEQHAEDYRAEDVDKYGMGIARRAHCIASEMKGVLALLPIDDDVRIWQSPIDPKEYFVEESLPVAYKIPEA